MTLWGISARSILLRLFIFTYTDKDRGCEHLLCFWLSLVKVTVSTTTTTVASSSPLQFIETVDPEIYRISAIKSKTVLQLVVKRFTPFLEPPEKAGTSGVSIPCHAISRHSLPKIACDFHRLITWAWSFYVLGTWISSPLFSPAETSSFDM